MAFRRLGLPLRGADQERRAPLLQKPGVVKAAPAGHGAEVTKIDGPITKPRAKLVVAATSNTEELARAPRPKLLRRVDVEVEDGAQKQRGRNLLGSLVAHLSSAQQRLKVDRETPGRAAAKKPQLSKAAAPARGVVKTIAKQPKLRKGQEFISKRRRLAQAAPRVEDLEELQANLAEHYSNMTNFIRTRADPTLFYLPAKHNPETEKCLQETRDTIQQKVRLLPKHLGTSTLVVDDEEAEEEEEGLQGEEEPEEAEEEPKLRAETNGEEKPALAPRRRAALTPAKAV